MSEETNILYGGEEIITKYQNLSIGKLLLNQIASHGTRIAQVNAHTGEEQQYADIFKNSKKLAVYLQREGLKPNDAIAICSENNLVFCIPVCAAIYLGAIVSPLNPRYSERELKHALSISKPKFIFTSPTGYNAIKHILMELYWLPRLIMLTEYADSSMDTTVHISWITMNNAILSINDNDINTFQATSVDVNNHVAVILYSSGTTGLPKGVMLTDKNLTTVIGHISNMDSNVNTLTLLPLFHAYAFIVMLLRLIIGNTSIVFSYFDAKHFLHSIEKYKIEHLTLVPTLMVFLAKHPLVDKYDLSSIKEIWCGAAPLSKEVQTAVAKRLNISLIRQGYGLTETTLAVTRFQDDKIKFGSVGKIVSGVSAKVIPVGEFETNKALGPNCTGELCFKGNLIMKGYYNDKKSTAATIDKDGWLHTGDIGYYDEEGYFYIVDRIKELIKYKGYQVPPAELEAVLLTYPGVKDAAVIGVPNEEVGELPMAFIIKQDNSNIREEEIIQYVNERVSNAKRLRGGIRFVNDIPRTASGKILRRVLRDTFKSKI